MAIDGEATREGDLPLQPATKDFCSRLANDVPDEVFGCYSKRFAEEPRGIFEGKKGVLLAPSTVPEVSSILRLCNEACVPVIPYGGGTGLVGGQVAVDVPKPVLLSLERMNSIRHVHPVDNVMVAEAGCILQHVQEVAEQNDRQFPLLIAARGSCQIGGTLATNAGGAHVLRYGNMRDLCLGLEFVFSDGSVLNGLSSLRKDNAGYDLANLIIGSEGTLGVITAASLKLFHRLVDEIAAVLAVENPRSAIEVFKLFRETFGNQLSAFELIHRTGLEFLAEVGPAVRLPFRQFPEWMVLVEVGAEEDAGLQGRLGAIAGKAVDLGLVKDGTIAQSETQRRKFWHMREAIPEANRRVGAISSHDVSVPISSIPDFVAEAGKVVASLGHFRINCFGHVGDGNLHYNVFPGVGEAGERGPELRLEMTNSIQDLVREYAGSIAAEHGIGRLKAEYFVDHGDPTLLAAMRRVKLALDPKGIMNPGAVLPALHAFSRRSRTTPSPAASFPALN